ncbi:hypothetical protein [Nocardioides sp.]|uniref:hypothetical protein n=1 Tax=Nocardioides sp. TaxID=35761 RepID=UPI0035172C1D
MSPRPALLRWRTRRHREREDRGAVAVVTGAVMVVLMIAAALVVDIGVQRVVRSDMQALADVVALDIARQLDGSRTAAQLTTGAPSQLQQWANASAARNRGENAGRTPTLAVVPGKVDTAGVFTAVTGTTVPTAVKVTATSTADFAFAGLTGRGSGRASRSAIASSSQGACFSVGSYAARIKTGDSTLLGPLLSALGGNITLGVADAGQLAAADVTLLQLVQTGLIAASPEAALTTAVKLSSLMLATAEVLRRESGQTAQIALLQRLATGTLGSTMVKLGDLLKLDTGSSAALNGSLNVFDLVSTGIFVANGTNAIALPNLNVNIPGVSQLAVSLTLGEKPHLACGLAGQARGSTSQVSLRITGSITNINLGLASVTSPLDIRVNVASAEGLLTSVTCTSSKRTLAITPSAGLLDLQMYLKLRATLLFIPIVDAPLRVYTQRVPSGTSSTPFTLDVPYNTTFPNGDYSALRTTGSNGLGAPALVADTSGISVLGLPLGTITSAIVDPLVSTVLTPLVTTLDSVLLTPLLRALGITVAGGEYRPVPNAECAVPKLVG